MKTRTRILSLLLCLLLCFSLLPAAAFAESDFDTSHEEVTASETDNPTEEMAPTEAEEEHDTEAPEEASEADEETVTEEAANTIGVGTGDWSNGWSWWSQCQSENRLVRNYGCLIVAQAKLLVLAGIASGDTSAFNPDVYLAWEQSNGYVNSGLATTNYAGPQAYASQCGATLTYEGTTTSNCNDKIWSNINSGKYSILRKYDSNGSHYVLVNNSASQDTGRLRVFNSYVSSVAGTTDWNYTTTEVLTYSITPTPIPSSAWYEICNTNGGLYLHSEANYNNSSIIHDANGNEVIMNNGEKVLFIEQLSGSTLTKVNYNGTIGWCSMNFMTVSSAPSYYLDVNGLLDGNSSGAIGGYGTFDVYINGSLMADDASDYCSYSSATSTGYCTYEITDIKAADGHVYNGISSGSLSGTLYADTSVTLSYSTSSYLLDVNGLINGSETGTLDGAGTFDMYINGSLVADDVNEYNQTVKFGSAYEIKDIKSSDGYTYNGVSAGSLTGTIAADTDVRLSFTGFAITSQPESVNQPVGSTAMFTVAASGTGLSYQWQYSKNGGAKWSNSPASGHSTATLSVSVTASRNGFLYRCIITDANGEEIISEPAEMTVKAEITSQPADISTIAGGTVEFTVTATGAGLEYQWQYLSDVATEWKASPATGNTTNTLKVDATASRNNYQYRCIITDANGMQITSDAARLTIESGITTQPDDVSKTVGSTARFKVAASGTDLSYQWQYSSDGGETWGKSYASGHATATLSISVTASRNGFLYRCIVTDANGVKATSNAARLTVVSAITAQPKSVTKAAGDTAKFTVTATGAGLTYQWQYSKDDGASWSNSPAKGATTKTLSFKATASRDGYLYRCVITDANGTVLTSNAAELTVS